MDRNIVYPGSIPLDTDLLNLNRSVLIALGAALSATLGTTPLTDGLAVTPTTPATLNVVVGPGCILSTGALDATAYGTLSADVSSQIVKMGVNLQPSILSLTAPTSPGTVVSYLIQASILEADDVPVVLPYYNAANPAQPFAGPVNGGNAQPTRRSQRVQVAAKPGQPGVAGGQGIPASDPGWLGIAVVTVSQGQTVVLPQHISNCWSGSFIPFKLPQLRPGFSSLIAYTTSGLFQVPPTVTTAKVTVVGGGGSGGTHQSLPGAGGGAGGQALRIVSGLTPGSTIPITVGTGGTSPASPADGAPGGSSSFGTYLSATGGTGGAGGSLSAINAGGPGGAGVGGDVNYGGSYGTDGIPAGQRGGDGGGPGAGRGSSGLTPGISATGYGGGGGGGGASAPNGAGTGAQGGNGGNGLVLVEF